MSTAPSGIAPPGFRRTLAGSLTGAVLEWYDFALYGALAATVFAGQFFPESSPHTGLLLAFATQASGFAMRPLGGIVFGHLGDRIGRKPVLVATYFLLAVATACIGLLPTYATWGLAAPVSLVVLRLVQGFALGGEFGAAVTLVGEYSPPAERGRWTALPQAGGPAGAVLATGVLTVIGWLTTEVQFQEWAWRIAFLLAIPLLLVGAWLRLRVEESPAYVAAVSSGQRSTSPVVEALRSPRPLLHGLGVRVGENVAFYVYTIFLLGYATRTLTYDVTDVLHAVLAASVCQMLAMLAGGALSDRVGRRPVMALAALGLAAWAPVFFALVRQESLPLLYVGVCVGATLHGLLAGPEAAWITELFPTRHRAAGSSLAFQGSSIVAGGPAPLVATALVGASGGTTWVVAYLVACALVSVVAVVTGPETRGRGLMSQPWTPDQTSVPRASS